VQKQLIKKIKDVQGCSHVMKLNEEEFKAAVGGGLEEVIYTFAKDTVSLSVIRDAKSITVYGTEQDFKTIRKIIRSHIGLFDEDMDLDAVCPACYTKPEDPFTTPCGHTYCQDCFVHQCSTEIPSIPITCYGNEATCNKLLALYALENALPSSEFESLLYNSFLVYVREHPLELAYCPTPDCPTIFRKTKDGSILSCHNCACKICTTCLAVEHWEMTCEQAADAASGGHAMFEKWKKENGARDCPECKMVCDLVAGCSGVQCANCKAFFCWYCAEVEKDGWAVHQHLIAAHGSYFPGREEVSPHIPLRSCGDHTDFHFSMESSTNDELGGSLSLGFVIVSDESSLQCILSYYIPRIVSSNFHMCRLTEHLGSNWTLCKVTCGICQNDRVSEAVIQIRNKPHGFISATRGRIA
jgi:hypothetical protein